MEVLWAGWRSAYVGGDPGEDGCLFCRLPEEADDDAYLLDRGERCFSVLNAFPYTSGHLMVAPYRHVGEPAGLTDDEQRDLWRLAVRGQQACGRALGAEGYNLGINVGRLAGAGVPDHLHLHVVPRWEGDTNFMTTAAEARVVPQALPDTWDRLREALGELG